MRESWSKVQPKQFRQIIFTCVLWSVPWSLPNHSCSQECYKNFHFVHFFPSFFFLLFFSSAITHNLLTKACKKLISFFTRMCLFIDTRLVTLLVTAENMDKRSVYDTIFFPRNSLLLTLMSVRKYKILISQLNFKIPLFVFEHLVSYVQTCYLFCTHEKTAQ